MSLKQLMIVWAMLLLSGCVLIQDKPTISDSTRASVSGDIIVSTVERK